MPLLGAHMSTAGGFYKAADAAAALGMDTVQIFTHSPSQWVVKPIGSTGKGSSRTSKAGSQAIPGNARWDAKPLADAEIARFQSAIAAGQLTRPISHSSYLINLASPSEELRARSVEALIVELRRAAQLGLSGVVLHPGASLDATEEQGLSFVTQSLDEIHRRTPDVAVPILLENTAGQGSCLGWRFEQLAAILQNVAQPERLGVCFDTCHAFAAGYPLARPAEYRRTIDELDRVVGLKWLRAFHLNDSKRELGSRVDRHEHIGRGCLGADAFRHLLRDRQFRDVPMYLETPKGEHEGRTWDEINLELLRQLARRGATPAKAKPE